MKGTLVLFAVLMACNFVSAQFKLNNIDTVSTKNKELIAFLGQYIEARAQGEPSEKYWFSEEYEPVFGLDANELWSNYYMSLPNLNPTLMGISRLEEDIYKMKIMIETGMDSTSMIVYAIQDFLIYDTDKGYKMGNMLNYNLKRHHYKKYSDQYFDYYYPEGTVPDDTTIQQKQVLLTKLETYFGNKIPHRFQLFYAPSCEDLYKLRGIDYEATMMSSKTSVCGRTFFDSRTMYSAYTGFHKHEIMRLLKLIVPKAPLILADGITNLTGGSAGKPIDYHIKKISTYLNQHPEKLDDIENFWYYDDETNPYFVFHALLTNYFLKTKGEEEFKKMMINGADEQYTIRSFVRTFTNHSDPRSFFIDQLNYYSIAKNKLEFQSMF